jgi:hypothetical protein
MLRAIAVRGRVRRPARMNAEEPRHAVAVNPGSDIRTLLNDAVVAKFYTSNTRRA